MPAMKPNLSKDLIECWHKLFGSIPDRTTGLLAEEIMDFCSLFCRIVLHIL